tara:strand:- start:1962 stop:3146 length:1185 start_codon:yes stop_codon:yes gene_type:complete
MSEKSREVAALLKKYALNKCTPEEIGVLTHLLQQNEVSENDIDVEGILESLGNSETLDKNKAEAVYQEVLKLGALGRIGSKRPVRKKVAATIAIAAVFAGLISLYIFQYYPLVVQPPTLESLIVNEEVTFEKGSLQIEISINKESKDSLIISKGKRVAKIINNTIVMQPSIQKSDRLEYGTLKVPYGKKAKVILADGTRVVLNSGTELRFPNYFPVDGKRKVELQGEAYFEVTKDKKHPFVVKTKNLDIEVLGTQFNVAAYQNDPKTNVVLVEGAVEIDFQSKENKINNTILHPGDMAIHNATNNSSIVNKVQPELYTSWIDGKLVFRNIEFNQLLTRLERHYNVSIINKDKGLGKEILNANFGDANIEEVFDYFNQIHEINYEITNSEIVIKK